VTPAAGSAAHHARQAGSGAIGTASANLLWARALLEGLVAGARAFAEGGPQTDDLTAIICKVGPEP